MNDGKAIRYGITVGEEAMAWSGIAKVGSMTEWPPWHPTKSEIYLTSNKHSHSVMVGECLFDVI